MNKRTKGALAMVLVGSLTFSVTNALLAHQSSKRLGEEKALTILGYQKKTVKDQTPITNRKDVQTKLSHNINAFQVSLKNKNKNDIVVAVIQQNTRISTVRTTTNPAHMNATRIITSAETTIPLTDAKAPRTTIPVTSPKATSTTTTSTTMGTNRTNTTSAKTTTTNHGQQVSQAAKENAASHQDKKKA